MCFEHKSYAQRTSQMQNGFTWDNATVYFMMTDRFYDGDPSNNNAYGRGKNGNGSNYTDDSSAGEFHGGDLKGITTKLREGYFESIGVNAIWITSPVEQMHGWVGGSSDGSFRHYGYHGYYAMDWSELDENMGTESDFEEFIDEAHSRGIRIIVDVVMNHTGYVTMQDMEEYNYGTVDPSWKSWQPSGSESWHSYHEKFIDYSSQGTWMTNYWGTDWMRHPDIGGYDDCSSGGGIDNCVGFLPDLKTEDIQEVGIPPILINKWTREGTLQEKTEALDTFFNSTGLPRVVSNYMIFWLTDWVKKYGIDGFRIDTAKHVELERWARLKEYAIQAFQTWKNENPSKKLDDEEFWMTAEVWGHGKNKSNYHTEGNFNSVINFGLKNDSRVKSRQSSDLESLYSEYATINDDPTWNSLSYLSSHDVPPLFDRNNLKEAAPAFLLLPGGIQIFYGDESGRPEGHWADEEQNTRSDMNWGYFDQSQHEVWKKLGTFRRDHPAVGAGTHSQINASPYTFVRDYVNQEKGIADRVIVAVGASGEVTFDVSEYYTDGDTVIDHYTGSFDVVENGEVKFVADAEGIVLLYDINYVYQSKPVITIAPDITYDENEIEVVITATDLEASPVVTYYTTDETEETSNYLNWNTYNGSFVLTSTTTVKVVAVNAEGRTSSKIKKYSIGQLDPVTFYFYKPSSWSKANFHHFDAIPQGILEDSNWPGVEMTDLGKGWYKTSLSVASTSIVFNDNGGVQSDDLSRDKTGWYKDGTWTDDCPGDCPGPAVPEVLINSTDTNFPSGIGRVALSATENGTIYYTIDGTTPSDQSTLYTEAFEISGNQSDIVTVKAIAYNENGASSIETSTFTFEQIESYTVYAKGYSHVYFWDVDENGAVEGMTTWPGVVMTDAVDVGEGWKKYTIVGKSCSHVIFNNNGASQTDDLSTCTKEGYGYDNGEWIALVDNQAPDLGLLPSDNQFYNEAEITLIALDNKDNSPLIYYTIDGTTPNLTSASAVSSVVFTISEIGMHTIKAFSVDADGNATEVISKTISIQEKLVGFRVYFQGVDNPLIHHWNALPVGSFTSSNWPGVSMEMASGDDEGWYYFEFPVEVTSVNLLFHNNNGFKTSDLTRDRDGWYKGGVWYDAKPEDPEGLKVHFKSDWGNNTHIYFWNASNGEAIIWPGVLMEYEGNGWYSYTIEGATSAQLLFHNGYGSQTTDLQRGSEGWYLNGVWYDVNPDSGNNRVVGLAKELEESVKVFPTVFSESFNLKVFSNIEQLYHYTVYNLNGKLIQSESNIIAVGEHLFNINAHQLGQGLHILKVHLGEETIIKKIYKK